MKVSRFGLVLSVAGMIGCATGGATAQPAAELGNVDLARYPSISPDGSTVVFSWRGDLWRAPVAGGTAIRLTTGPADELTSTFSPDGSQIAFISNLSGDNNVHVMNVDGTNVRQVTRIDRPITLGGWVNDGIIVAVRVEGDVFPNLRPHIVPVEGGEMTRLHDAFGSEPNLSPDGTKLLFTRGGGSWLRRGYQGADARELWVFDRTTKTFTQLTRFAGNDGMGRWIDNQRYVFMSERLNDTNNLFINALGQADDQATPLTRFDGDGVEGFDLTTDGRTLVYTRWGRVHTAAVAGLPGADARAVAISAADDPSDRVELRDISRQISEVALSPDGKTMAAIAYGQVYVKAVGSKTAARRVSVSPARHTEIAWSADGVRLYFVSRETGIESIHAATVALTRDEIRKQLAPSTQPATTQPATQPTTDETVAAVADTSDAAPTTQAATSPTTAEAGKSEASPKPDPARWADAVRFEIELVSASDDDDSMPSPSPDGRHLAFQRGVGSLWLKDLKTGEAREVLSGWSASLEAVWSPDSAFIAFVTEDRNYNADIWIVPADASAPAVNVTRHPDNDYAPRFSADGKIMAFLSQRNDNEPDVYVLWLDKAMEAATPAELEQYFKDANAAVRKRTPIKPVSFKSASTQPATQPATRPTSKPSIAADDLEDAYLRVRRITSIRGNEGALLLAPAGDKVYFMASLVGPRSLHVAGIDTPGEPRRVAGTVSPAGISLTGDQIAAVSASQAAIIKLPAGEVETIAIEDRLLLDRAEQARLKFIEAARVYATRFYANDMKGRDWAALTQKYLSLAERTRTSHEFDWVGARLLGELNASHTGISSPSTTLPVRQPIGKLGIETKRNDRGIEVVSVLGEGPAGKGPMRLLPGDIITAIEFKPIKPTDTLDDALAGRVGNETVFTVLRANDAAPAREINLLLTPVSSAALSGMIYDDWRLSNARKVREMSNGRLGYIHIRGMNQESLDIFERDLYAAADGKDGLIIDVRNNGGGWTADRLLASIMAPRHAYTIPRGMKNAPTDGYPQDRLFIQRYDLPINMLANERSFSNAEITAHAFKTLKRGTLVGQPTAGGVISTGATTLLDGTSVRVPFRGWYLPDGTDMENNGAVPDLLVPQTPEAESAGEDAQLQVAVEDLLNRLNRKE